VNVHRISINDTLLSLNVTGVPLIGSPSSAPIFFVPAFAPSAHSPLTFAVRFGYQTTSVSAASGLKYALATQQASRYGGSFGAQSAAGAPLTTTIDTLVGDSTMSIRSIAEDGATMQVYVINVHVESHDATLAMLTIAPAGSPQLTPTFAAATGAYNMSQASTQATYTATMTVNYALTNVSYTYGVGAASAPAAASASYPTYVASGAPTPSLQLSYGDNFFYVQVISEDGVRNFYSVNVRRVSDDAHLANMITTPTGNGTSHARSHITRASE
jgi:hypothetical protein